MELIKLFRQANRNVISLLEKIDDVQWHNPTPNTEWDVRELVSHLTVENLWLPLLLEGKTIAEVGDQFDGDVLGDQPKIASVKALEDSLKTLNDPALLNMTVHLSFGDTLGSEYIEQMLTDAVIHGWDLAASIGASRAIDPTLVQAVLTVLEPSVDDWRNAGVFAPMYELPDDRTVNSQDRLIALSGRNPDWQPVVI